MHYCNNVLLKLAQLYVCNNLIERRSSKTITHVPRYAPRSIYYDEGSVWQAPAVTTVLPDLNNNNNK
jgi:hypothetical protein